MIRKKLYTIGELLRCDQLEPDPESVISVEAAKQLHFFSPKRGKSKGDKKSDEQR